MDASTNEGQKRKHEEANDWLEALKANQWSQYNAMPLPQFQNPGQTFSNGIFNSYPYLFPSYNITNIYPEPIGLASLPNYRSTKPRNSYDLPSSLPEEQAIPVYNSDEAQPWSHLLNLDMNARANNSFPSLDLESKNYYERPVTPAKNEERAAQDGSQPVTVFRNLFHTVTCSIQGLVDPSALNGFRIYVADCVGYSGNATRFKRKPDEDESAYILDMDVTDPDGNPVEQCKTCKEYYNHQKYFRSSPEALGRVVLVKNNAPIRIDANGSFHVQLKIMCACAHHNVDYFKCFISVRLPDSAEPSFSSQTTVYAKQWRKSSQKKEEIHLQLTPTTPPMSSLYEGVSEAQYCQTKQHPATLESG